MFHMSSNFAKCWTAGKSKFEPDVLYDELTSWPGEVNRTLRGIRLDDLQDSNDGQQTGVNLERILTLNESSPIILPWNIVSFAFQQFPAPTPRSR